MVYKVTQTKNAAALFEGWQESMIWSCMQGVMGELYADDPQHPKSAMVWLGDFCLFAGEPSQELARFRLSHPKRPFMIMVPQTEEWGRMIEHCYGERAKKVTRYASPIEWRKSKISVASYATIPARVHSSRFGFSSSKRKPPCNVPTLLFGVP